uniref:Putative secreted protein n=1 Tax=Anopheles triannulatus TaxID=58253 RepID=A0A2M4B6J1_9DIPT
MNRFAVPVNFLRHKRNFWSSFYFAVLAVSSSCSSQVLTSSSSFVPNVSMLSSTLRNEYQRRSWFGSIGIDAALTILLPGV